MELKRQKNRKLNKKLKNSTDNINSIDQNKKKSSINESLVDNNSTEDNLKVKNKNTEASKNKWRKRDQKEKDKRNEENKSEESNYDEIITGKISKNKKKRLERKRKEEEERRRKDIEDVNKITDENLGHEGEKIFNINSKIIESKELHEGNEEDILMNIQEKSLKNVIQEAQIYEKREESNNRKILANNEVSINEQIDADNQIHKEIHIEDEKEKDVRVDEEANEGVQLIDQNNVQHEDKNKGEEIFNKDIVIEDNKGGVIEEQYKEFGDGHNEDKNDVLNKALKEHHQEILMEVDIEAKNVDPKINNNEDLMDAQKDAQDDEQKDIDKKLLSIDDVNDTKEKLNKDQNEVPNQEINNQQMEVDIVEPEKINAVGNMVDNNIDHEIQQKEIGNKDHIEENDEIQNEDEHGEDEDYNENSWTETEEESIVEKQIVVKKKNYKKAHDLDELDEEGEAYWKNYYENETNSQALSEDYSVGDDEAELEEDRHKEAVEVDDNNDNNQEENLAPSPKEIYNIMMTKMI